MHILKVVAVICAVITLASAGAVAADATRAKGAKPLRTATPVAHPKGKICPKTGRLVLPRK